MAARKFQRSATDRKIAGVCGGLAAYFGVDPTLVRVLWIVVTIASVGVGLLGYLLLWIASPVAPEAGEGQALVPAGPR